ncbi:hypothetical protein T03_784 [Trichinella britovi]|uniref:Uncharacterized protein n=1 Tax=Trichinella britovi TaxID=45882 RepID=A0A0V1D5N7_TRIBR|nr:hypothetical protein T03_784 [Trichinella britovi]
MKFRGGMPFMAELFRQKTKRRKAKATVGRIVHEDQRQITVVVVYVCTWQLASCQEMRFGASSLSVLAFDCLIKYILIVCRLIVAIPSGKRETERKGNAPVNTSSSPNSDGRTNNLVLWTRLLEGAARYNEKQIIL